MLEPETSARIANIIGNNRCDCGKEADRFRIATKNHISFYCNQCYAKTTSEEEIVTFRPHRVHLTDSIYDPDNMPDLFWSPPSNPNPHYVW